MKEVLITINGEAMTGKSTVMALISKTLADHGFSVEFEPWCGADASLEITKILTGDIRSRTAHLKDQVKIKLKEEQAQLSH